MEWKAQIVVYLQHYLQPNNLVLDSPQPKIHIILDDILIYCIFLQCGCNNKLPWNWGLKITKNIFCYVLEGKVQSQGVGNAVLPLNPLLKKRFFAFSNF